MVEILMDGRMEGVWMEGWKDGRMGASSLPAPQSSNLPILRKS